MMRGVTNLLIAVLVTTFTMGDLLNTACHVGCRKENFDAGFYVQKGMCSQVSIFKFHFNKKECACISFIEFDDVTAKSVPRAFEGHSEGDSQGILGEPAHYDQ